MSAGSARRDWMLQSHFPSKVERIEAYFSGHGYEPHRHDTYAIGLTMSGVQSFRYRGGMRHSLPGGAMVLHPDELHDGRAGTDEGFRYRMLYIDPVLIQQALGGKALPFVADGLSNDVRVLRAIDSLMQAMERPVESLEEDDAIHDLAHALEAAAGKGRGRRAIDYQAAERARSYILDMNGASMTIEELERISGRDQSSLSRDFRALYGTSPYRYVTMRRLDICRDLLLSGSDLADAALAAGFYDQSHMTRQFRNTFGLSPARWLLLLKSL
ncbi:AraC family transcriptional regulator [Metapseudomonas resinovorans]|uniref:Putative AraC family transcriptional regulator n=1 Tax=Metapseudomonas resinovorans NBRC 106553 TaxID=1245471 RepID=S6AEI1_METRE|nr:AraC family transcriptional regulator [Pseudomonas resinovorans]BAN48067.1 putative AraC family transcriptional regulator [Pseudomonas resinovorans NBRC 106553]